MEPTRFKGVYKLSPGRWQLRWKSRDPKTGKLRDHRPKVPRRGEPPIPNAAAANRRRDELMQQAATDAQAYPRLSDFAASWLAGKMPDLSHSTRSTYAGQLAHVCDFRFADGRCFGDFYVDAIEHADVIAYRDQSAAAVRPDTVNGRLRTLRNCMGDAVATLGLPRDPTLRVKPLPKAPPRRERPLTPEQLRDVLDYFRAHEWEWYPLVLSLAVSGMRWSEATALKWSDLSGDTITVRRRNIRGVLQDGTKSGRGVFRVLPLAPELASVLEIHKRLQGRCAWVFPGPGGEPWPNGSTAIRKPLRRCCEQLSLERVVSAHDFRHTWNNILRQVTQREVQQSITGHSTDEMSEHYASVSQSERMAATRAGLRLIMGGE